MQIQYTFSLEQAQQHLIGIQLSFHNKKKQDVDVILPAWRPGRYERANYAANIKEFEVKVKGKRLSFEKTERNTWTIARCPAGTVEVSYQYYADTINAGSSYVDEDQLYVNPVNCCMHPAGQMKAEVEAYLEVPAGFKYSGMLPYENGRIQAADVDAWYDSPFVSAAQLIQHRFRSKGIDFEIAIRGDVPYEKKQIESDFKKFIATQMKAFKSCPVDRYTFLIMATPHRYYHGVEHEWGTTITLGPARSLLSGSVYKDLLGVSSHELYHTWNVKYMRPKEMWPYDFTQENYHRVGYIIEGVTTYQGDLKLWQSGVMSDEDFLKEIKTHLDRHVANFGRMNLSVRESSFDTWVDGYGASIPDRKVSIYTEGALISMMIDIAIMYKTKGRSGLDQVMRKLYEQCKKKGRGYSEEDYLSIIEGYLGKDIHKMYRNFIDKAVGYEKEVYKALKQMGISVKTVAKDSLSARYGLRVDGAAQPRILSVHPQSMAYAAGIRPGMVIIGLDGQYVEGDAEQLITRKELNLILKDNKVLKVKDLQEHDGMLYVEHELSLSNSGNAHWRKWKKGVF